MWNWIIGELVLDVFILKYDHFDFQKIYSIQTMNIWATSFWSCLVSEIFPGFNHVVVYAVELVDYAVEPLCRVISNQYKLSPQLNKPDIIIHRNATCAFEHRILIL